MLLSLMTGLRGVLYNILEFFHKFFSFINFVLSWQASQQRKLVQSPIVAETDGTIFFIAKWFQ